jgi:succinate dehydrogenase hydrophobic anchor subunit
MQGQPTAAVNNTRPLASSGHTSAASRWFLVQVISGVLLIIALAFHMIAHHFIVKGGLRDYKQVLDYVQHPVMFVLEAAFIIVATVHALLGVRAILYDLGPAPAAARWIDRGLLALGALTTVYGLWLAVALQGLR